MQLTIDIDEAMLRNACERATAAVFNTGSDYRESGAGYDAIKAQATAWAKGQDYTPLFEALAGRIIREAVGHALRVAIEAEMKRAVKGMKDRGEIAAMVEEAR